MSQHPGKRALKTMSSEHFFYSNSQNGGVGGVWKCIPLLLSLIGDVNCRISNLTGGGGGKLLENVRCSSDKVIKVDCEYVFRVGHCNSANAVFRAVVAWGIFAYFYNGWFVVFIVCLLQAEILRFNSISKHQGWRGLKTWLSVFLFEGFV